MHIYTIVMALAWSGAASAVTVRLNAFDTQADVVSAIWQALPEDARGFDYISDSVVVRPRTETIRIELPARATPAQTAALRASIANIRENVRTPRAIHGVRFGATPVEVVTGSPDAVDTLGNVGPHHPTGVTMILRADARWSAAECAAANLQHLRTVLQFAEPADETLIEISDLTIDATRRAAVRQHFAIRIGDPLFGGRFTFNGRVVRVIWPASHTPNYAPGDHEYPYHQTPSDLSRLIDERLRGGATDERFDFAIAAKRGRALWRHAREVLTRIERAGAFDRTGDVLRGDDGKVALDQRADLHAVVAGRVAEFNRTRPLHAHKIVVWRSQLSAVCDTQFLH